jgi:hypothetical protein
VHRFLAHQALHLSLELAILDERKDVFVDAANQRSPAGSRRRRTLMM